MKAVVSLCLAGLLISCTDAGVAYPQREVPQQLLNSAQARQAGKELFMDDCAFCHGHLDEGRSLRANDYDPPPMNFSDPRYQTVDPAYLFWRIAEGKTEEPFRSRGSVMPAWGAHYSDKQIWQLIAYLKARAR